MTRKVAGILLGALLLLGFAGVANAGTAYTAGDVFLGVANVGVEEFTPTGTLVQTINGGGLTGFVTGMAFQNNGNLLVTDFSAGTVAQYDNSGNLLNASFASGIGAPESIAIDAAGHVYVSSVGGTGITEYNSTGGASIGTSLVGTRTDWIDLASDQHTMLYTDEGGTTHSVNVATNTPNADFSTQAGAFALRIIPPGSTDAGDVLVANRTEADLLDSAGNIITHYSLPGNGGGDFSLNLDPNGTDFWTADFVTGEVWEVNIATGAIDNMWNSGASGDTLFGLTVFGQLTASGGGGGGGGTTVPEPSSICLLLTGLVGVALKKLRG